MTLRDKMIVLRDKAGISQMALAEQLGVSRQAVTRWESGDTTPSMDKLKALAKIYDVSLDWLCSDTADGKSFEEVVEPVEDNGTYYYHIFPQNIMCMVIAMPVLYTVVYFLNKKR